MSERCKQTGKWTSDRDSWLFWTIVHPSTHPFPQFRNKNRKCRENDRIISYLSSKLCFGTWKCASERDSRPKDNNTWITALIYFKCYSREIILQRSPHDDTLVKLLFPFINVVVIVVIVVVVVVAIVVVVVFIFY